MEQLFEVFKGDRLELVVHIAAYYGLRKSEIIGLKWDSVKFEEKKLTVRRKVSSTYGDGKETLFVENQLKTESSVRTFPLIPHIEKMLRERKTLEEYYSKLLGKDFDREYDGFVCRDNFGKLISPNFVTDHFRYIVKKHNLRRLRFHDLRHSCASLLLANNIPMKAIQEWLGHSTFTVTANFYSHLDYNSKLSSADTISRVLGGVTESGEGETTEFA
ncbi:site-specific integrase [Ruminococcus sp.]|uniref:site-specific integrase n=1 Tax=Ruminococcus sp. TaxID=41978 RepID=UPI0025D1FAE1|nr:site-specific integrase [Ruminococcus sp.]